MIDKSTRDIQGVCFEILNEIDRVCKKYDIPYLLTGGTALGARRHSGFIPWDDDMDIAFSRKDYHRFIQAMDQDLDSHFYYHCFEKDKRYNVLLPHMKVRKRGTYIKERNVTLKHGCDGDGLFVDVFIYDHVSDYKILNAIARCYMYLLSIPIYFFTNLGFNPLICKFLFNKGDALFQWLFRNSNSIGVSYTWIYSCPFKQYVFPKDVIYPLRPLKFNGKDFMVAGQIDKYLEIEFGPTFMEFPPVEKRIAKHTIDYSTTSDYPIEELQEARQGGH